MTKMTKEETNKVKVKNSDSVPLLSVFQKLCKLDFDLSKEEENVDDAIEIAESLFSIEDAFKAYQKLEKNILEKVESERDPETKTLSPELIEKVNSDMKALGEKQVSIEIKPVKRKYINKVKVNPIEIVNLKRLGLILD